MARIPSSERFSSALVVNQSSAPQTNAPKPTNTPSPESNLEKVMAIADCLYTLKLSDDLVTTLGVVDMLKKCTDAASSLGSKTDVPEVQHDDVGVRVEEIDVIRLQTNHVIDSVDEINSFVSRAKANGFSQPQNPLARIAKFNTTRAFVNNSGVNRIGIFPNSLENTLANDLMFNLNILLDLVKKEKDGEIDFDNRSLTTAGTAAQLSSYDISLDGYDIDKTGGSADLLSFLPDVDKIKRARVKASLGSLNFDDRIPRIVFTVNYDPDGISQGAIVGWKRIIDASGYVIRRHSVFDNEDVEFNFTNEDALSQYEAVKDYVNEWVLSFYDQIDDDMIFAFLDTEVVKHNFYTYHLEAIQKIRSSNKFIFNIDSAVSPLSLIALNDIEKEIRTHVKETVGKKYNRTNVDSICPYPFLSRKLYGHDKFDWILAAMNVATSIERNDERSTVKEFSYLEANFSTIRRSISNGKFVKPVDPNAIINNLKESISTFGVSQTLLEVITFTGLDVFFGKKQDNDNTFKRATDVYSDDDSTGISMILASIDIETATIDMSALVSNLLSITEGSVNKDEVDESTTVSEISVPDEDETKVDTELEEDAEDSLQFVGNFEQGEDFLDLTTFEGISEFIRTIRLFFDQNPNRKANTRNAGASTGPSTRVTLPDGSTRTVSAFRASRSQLFNRRGGGGTSNS
ncbi:MAG: hypothetical protein ACW99G_04145 [Candidatus Thorarchaeota archaeon]|jgi:hypothetical protein